MSSPATTELRVIGMTCNNCARHVTEAIQSVPGVYSASVSLQAKAATVNWSSGDAKNVPAVLTAVSQAGYSAKEAPTSDGLESRQSRWEWNLIIGLGVTGVLMMGEWVFGLAMAPWFQWAAFVLAGIVQIFCGAQFYTGAWRQLKIGQSNMDTLVALGSTTAFGYSAWALLAGIGGHVYFMEAAAIISLISFGHWMEARVSDQASGALKSLLHLAPPMARKLVSRSPREETQAKPFNLRSLKLDPPSPNRSSRRKEAPSEFPGKMFEPPHVGCYEVREEGRGEVFFPPTLAQAEETDVAVDELQIGDRVALRPGDRVPVDGLVLEGESAVDEAMLTGESAPVDKKSGSDLFAGTVNQNGRLIMRVTATGEATALAHVIAAVQRAQTSRANIQRLGDRISNVFVPVIVCLALAAGLWWGLAPASANHVHAVLATFFWHAHAPTGVAAGFIIAAAVLIIACPCAMGLATPAAIMASANAAARLGILIRDGVALEKAGEVTAVIFDKTGTLTAGKPEVAAVLEINGQKPELKNLAAAMAKNSTHPISQAIAKMAAETVELSDWREIRGAGVEAKLSNFKSQISNPAAVGQASSLPATGRLEACPTAIRLGSLRWLRECGVDLVAGEKFIGEWSSEGATLVGLAEEKQLLALFAVRDAVKPHSAAVVKRLQQQGLKTFLVTGDNVPTAVAIAKHVGIPPENVFAEVRPEQKAEFVKKLQAQNERVAFVGDGINDAPALTQADLGIAVSRASDVAREAADIILLKSEIEAVPEALGLARATLRTIKQNLFWAFFYNALGVPLAALGFISPIFCAAAMGVSDLVVIGNALRLLRWRR